MKGNNTNSKSYSRMRVRKLTLTEMLNGALGVKAGKGLITPLIWVVRSILGVRVATWSRVCVVFSRFVYKLWKHRGKRGLTIYLKAAHIYLMQARADMKISDSGVHGARVSRTRGGIPRCIPVVMRNAIRFGDVNTLRAWLTLLSLYRVIEYTGVLKISTITDPCTVQITAKYMKGGVQFVNDHSIIRDWKGSKDSPPKVTYNFIRKSSPSLFGFKISITKAGTSTSILGIVSSAFALRRSDIGNSISVFALRFLGGPVLIHRIDMVSEMAEVLANAWTLRKVPFIYRDFGGKRGPGTPYIGKLGQKAEAAGKIRVFAMVDCGTQWLMRPLHLTIFHILRQIPMDGTFDQIACVKRLMSEGYTSFGCYDLSAATDRLPIAVQIPIVNAILSDKTGVDYGYHGAKILVGRGYLLKKSMTSKKILYYAVGQPMGALSSGGMLALTHHLIVQRAAARAGRTSINGWYTKAYAVLGDDIVICDGEVARQYRKIMLELGVQISAAKSLVSHNGCLEFAKRFFVNQVDCSPVPLKELGAAKQSLGAMLEYARRYNLSIASVLDLVNFGFRGKGNLPKKVDKMTERLRRFVVSYYSPWGVQPLDINVGATLRTFIGAKVGYSILPDQLQSWLVLRVRKLTKKLELNPFDFFDRVRLGEDFRSIERMVSLWFTEFVALLYDEYRMKFWKNSKGLFLTLAGTLSDDVRITSQKIRAAKDAMSAEWLHDTMLGRAKRATTLDILLEIVKIDRELVSATELSSPDAPMVSEDSIKAKLLRDRAYSGGKAIRPIIREIKPGELLPMVILREEPLITMTPGIPWKRYYSATLEALRARKQKEEFETGKRIGESYGGDGSQNLVETNGQSTLLVETPFARSRIQRILILGNFELPSTPDVFYMGATSFGYRNLEDYNFSFQMNVHKWHALGFRIAPQTIAFWNWFQHVVAIGLSLCVVISGGALLSLLEGSPNPEKDEGESPVVLLRVDDFTSPPPGLDWPGIALLSLLLGSILFIMYYRGVGPAPVVGNTGEPPEAIVSHWRDVAENAHQTLLMIAHDRDLSALAEYQIHQAHRDIEVAQQALILLTGNPW